MSRLVLLCLAAGLNSLAGAEVSGWIGHRATFHPTPTPTPWMGIMAGAAVVTVLAYAVWRLVRWWRRPRPWNGYLRIEAITRDTPDIATFRLVHPDGRHLPFRFLPGQYLMVKLHLDGRTIRRCFSLATAPAERRWCDISVRRNSQGVVSPYLHQKAAVGEILEIQAPYGAFTFLGHESPRLILLGGGVGITPLMSVLRQAVAQAWKGELVLVFACRRPVDVLYREELLRLVQQIARPRLSVHILVEDPAGMDWDGRIGRITPDLLREIGATREDTRTHLCGPPPMMAVVAKMYAELQVPAERLVTESFAGSGGGPLEVVELAAGQPATGPTVTFARSGRRFLLPAGRTVLDLAEAAGIDLEYSCRTGLCGSCKLKLLSGSVAMADDHCLSARERSAGYILACQAKVVPEVVVDA